MDDLYLDDTKRKFYSVALAHIKNCDHKDWDLDEGLVGYIDKINLNPKIRTMYSKRGRLLGYGQHSYLVICYIKDAESTLKNEVEPALRLQFRSNLYAFSINPEFPRIDSETAGADPCLKYIADPSYWNIHRIRYQLKGGGNDDHDRFWNQLKELLSAV